MMTCAAESVVRFCTYDYVISFCPAPGVMQDFDLQRRQYSIEANFKKMQSCLWTDLELNIMDLRAERLLMTSWQTCTNQPFRSSSMHDEYGFCEVGG